MSGLYDKNNIVILELKNNNGKIIFKKYDFVKSEKYEDGDREIYFTECLTYIFTQTNHVLDSFNTYFVQSKRNKNLYSLPFCLNKINQEQNLKFPKFFINIITLKYSEQEAKQLLLKYFENNIIDLRNELTLSEENYFKIKEIFENKGEYYEIGL